MTEVKNINFDGKDYAVSEFSEQVQSLTSLLGSWQSDLVREQVALAKTDSAIKALSKELSELVSKELADKAEPEVTDVEAKGE
jgi:hypothetical protein